MGVFDSRVQKYAKDIGRFLDNKDKSVADRGLFALNTAGVVPGLAMDYLGYPVTKALEKPMGMLMESSAGKTAMDYLKGMQEEYPRAMSAAGSAMDVSGLANIPLATTRNASLRGIGTSNLSNYIEGHYKPSEVQISKKIEDAVSPAVAAGLQKAKGFTQWGAKGISDAIHSTLSPYQRALYSDTGITKKLQDQIKEVLPKVKGDPEKWMKQQATVSNRNLEKLVAQSLYTSHIGKQAGRSGFVNEGLKEMAEGTMAKTYFGDKKGFYNETVMGLKDKGVKVTPHDGSLIENHIRKQWGWDGSAGTNLIVVKNATGRGRGGSHQQDLLYSKNHAINPIKDAFVDLKKSTGRSNFKDNMELHRYLTKHQGLFRQAQAVKKGIDKPKDFAIKFDKMDDINANGVWINNSLVGGAVTEGSVNSLIKIMPDGRMLGVMSDVHNFGEKITDKVKGYLPNEVMAVTIPMSANIKNIKKRDFAKLGVSAKATPVKAHKPEVTRATEQQAHKIANAQPTTSTLRKEQALAATRATGLFSGVVKEEQ